MHYFKKGVEVKTEEEAGEERAQASVRDVARCDALIRQASLEELPIGLVGDLQCQAVRLDFCFISVLGLKETLHATMTLGLIVEI